jgi:hypothetical protein
MGWNLCFGRCCRLDGAPGPIRHEAFIYLAASVASVWRKGKIGSRHNHSEQMKRVADFPPSPQASPQGEGARFHIENCWRLPEFAKWPRL